MLRGRSSESKLPDEAEVFRDDVFVVIVICDEDVTYIKVKEVKWYTIWQKVDECTNNVMDCLRLKRIALSSSCPSI